MAYPSNRTRTGTKLREMAVGSEPLFTAAGEETVRKVGQAVATGMRGHTADPDDGRGPCIAGAWDAPFTYANCVGVAYFAGAADFCPPCALQRGLPLA